MKVYTLLTLLDTLVYTKFTPRFGLMFSKLDKY